MNNTRYCQIKGHQENNTPYICTHKDCKLDSNWVCVDYSQSRVAQLESSYEIISIPRLYQKAIIISIQQKQEDRKLIQICVKELKYFIQSTQFLMQKLKEDLVNIEKNYKLEEIEQIFNITKNNYLLLENIQIEKIINFKNCEKKQQQNLSQDVINQIIQLHQGLSKILENNFKTYVQEIILDHQIIQPNAILVYNSHFEHKQLQIHTSQISYDEKYLVFGGSDHKIQIYDFVTKQLIQSIKIGNSVSMCKFTKDSQLICGDSKGFLFCFDINNNFIQKYKKQLHQSWIYDILPIDDDQIITCSGDKSIIITNIKEKTQQLIIQNAHKDIIFTIDYDQQNNVIIVVLKINQLSFLIEKMERWKLNIKKLIILEYLNLISFRPKQQFIKFRSIKYNLMVNRLSIKIIKQDQIIRLKAQQLYISSQ